MRYSTKDVLRIVGISRATLYKWFRDGKLSDVHRDRNDFRIFTDTDIEHILRYKNGIKIPTTNDER